MENPVTVKFICRELAELFGAPCNFSFCEDALFENAEAWDWCEAHCGEATDAECWEHYFKVVCAEEADDG